LCVQDLNQAVSRLQTRPIFFHAMTTHVARGEAGTRRCGRGGAPRDGTVRGARRDLAQRSKCKSSHPHLDRVERVHDAVLEDSCDGTRSHGHRHIGSRQPLVLVRIHGRVGCGVSACRRTPLLESSVPDRRPNAPALRSVRLSRAQPTEKLHHLLPLASRGGAVVVLCSPDSRLFFAHEKGAWRTPALIATNFDFTC
jgi:hypothetical protein